MVGKTQRKVRNYLWGINSTGYLVFGGIFVLFSAYLFVFRRILFDETGLILLNAGLVMILVGYWMRR